MITNPEIFKALVSAIPHSFIEKLHQDIPNGYSEAHSAVSNDPIIEESEYDYLMPHYRRAISETIFRKAATEAGLIAIALENIRHTARYSLVKCGPFLITQSYVSEPGKFVRAAHFRSQHASLNALLAQGRFPEFDTSETFQGEPDNIYCILLHGADLSDKRKTGFMELAIPHSNAASWIDRYKLSDVLLAAQVKRDADNEQQDKAHPTLKPIPKEGTGEM